MDLYKYVSAVHYRSAGFLIALFIITVVSFSGYCLLYAETTSDSRMAENTSPEKSPYVITSDRLNVNSNDNSAEFIGNVKVTQGNMVITAPRIQLFYRNDLAKENALKADEASIKEIIATDTVTIKVDNTIAMTDRAVYNTQEKILILSGENSKIIMDENTITGTRITFYRTDGRIAVEGGQNERVKAIFYNNEGQIQ